MHQAVVRDLDDHVLGRRHIDVRKGDSRIGERFADSVARPHHRVRRSPMALRVETEPQSEFDSSDDATRVASGDLEHQSPGVRHRGDARLNTDQDFWHELALWPNWTNCTEWPFHAEVWAIVAPCNTEQFFVVSAAAP